MPTFRPSTAGSDFYDGIISPNGGLYKPGPHVMLPPVSRPTMSARVTGRPMLGSTASSNRAALSAIQQVAGQPAGSVVGNKDQSRLLPQGALAFNGQQPPRFSSPMIPRRGPVMAQFQMPGQLPGQVEGFDANSILMRSQDPEMRALGAKRSASPSDGVVAALAAPQGPTGVAGGYQYVNGKQVGRDPRFALMSPSDTYDALNAKSIDQLVLKNNRPESGPSSGSLVSGKDSPLRAGRPRVIGRY